VLQFTRAGSRRPGRVPASRRRRQTSMPPSSTDGTLGQTPPRR
jgi:hypothetical protein